MGDSGLDYWNGRASTSTTSPTTASPIPGRARPGATCGASTSSPAPAEVLDLGCGTGGLALLADPGSDPVYWGRSVTDERYLAVSPE